MSNAPRSRMVVSPLWLQVVVLTFLVGFAILGYLAIRVYQDHPPVPGRVVSEAGKTVFTAEDVRSGQELFLTYGLKLSPRPDWPGWSSPTSFPWGCCNSPTW